MSERTEADKLADLREELTKMVSRGHDATANLADRLMHQPDEARLEVLGGAQGVFESAARATAGKFALRFLERNPGDVSALHEEVLDRVLFLGRDSSCSTSVARNLASACERMAWGELEQLLRSAS